MSSGAADALDKTAELDQLVDAVRRLHRGAPSRPKDLSRLGSCAVSVRDQLG
jgi:hypothetical protein